MLPQSAQQAIMHSLKVNGYFDTETLNIKEVGGGSINDTYRITLSGHHSFFCKVNSATNFPHLFKSECRGLFLIQQQEIIATPKIIDQIEINDQQLLLMEWIHQSERTNSFWKIFGSSLAQLHQSTNEYFGLNEDNYMGSVPQSNKPTRDWADFFILQRLQPLTYHCNKHHLLPAKYMKQFNKLYKHLPSIFDTDQQPALVHGDLWNGNFMCNTESQPVLIDPAVYYGHPSIDLAMSTLFGGFHPIFYEAYNYYKPFPSNYKEQWQICNLYPLLIHLRLFGTSYLPAIVQTLNDFN